MYRKNAWNDYSEKDLKAVFAFTDDYKDYLSKGKTERECVDLTVEMAEQAGFKDLKELIKLGKPLTPGEKVYITNYDRQITLFILGKKPLEAGMRILGAHIDSPRLDVKQNPLYESEGFVLLDTHYYGGVKKYQWVTIPLAIHGVVYKKNGKKIVISIGEKDDEPVVGISDLLIHLSQEQMQKKASVVIEGEKLDVTIGSIPQKDQDTDAIKANIVKLLNDKYDIEEEDLVSAELEIIPAGPARDYGLDASMIMGYGHDDRVCAYTSLRAFLEYENPEYTTCCMLVDKEEIGSVGATGMSGYHFETTVAELCELQNEGGSLKVRRALQNSKMLSSDVSPALDPLYAEAYEKKSAAIMGYGICFNKFTGSRGKSGANDANPEYIALIRNILDEAKVHYQTCELGKVDLGGGGTIAYLCAKYNMEVIDAGVAVINMHAPNEVVSKADVYEAYRCYKVFIEKA